MYTPYPQGAMMPDGPSINVPSASKNTAPWYMGINYLSSMWFCGGRLKTAVPIVPSNGEPGQGRLLFLKQARYICPDEKNWNRPASCGIAPSVL